MPNTASVQFGELRPDIALLDNQYASQANNVYAASNSYKPIPSLLAFASTTLAGAQGLFAARKQDGTWQIYGGTSTKLYKWTASAGWTDISRLAGGNYHVASNELWSWGQFGTTVIACQLGDVPQFVDTEAGGNFALLNANAPTARTVAIVGDFVVLCGLSSNQRAIQWSSLNNPFAWVVSVQLCDIQSFPEMGPVQGVSGSETSAYVLQDRGIRSMQFLPSDTTYVFQFTRVVKDRGSVSKYGYCTVSDVLYFGSDDGFYALAGNQLMPIGQDKINDYWASHSDVGRRSFMQCFGSNKPFIFFPFYSSPSSTTYDAILIYNWTVQRWTTCTQAAAVWAMLSTTSIDLDTDSGETGDSNADTTTLPSLDSLAYLGGIPTIMGMSVTGALSSLTGPNLAATIETAEAHLTPGMRSYISNVYPLIDAPNVTIAVAGRERLQDAAVYGPDVGLEVTGNCSIFHSARLHRFRATIPFGDAWTNAQGIQADVQPDGYA